MKKVYLAGAIGCYPPNSLEPRAWREKATESLSDFDFEVINPMDFYNYDTPSHQTEKEVMNFDLRCVRSSDVILVNLKDIDKSLGTSDEIFMGYLCDIPIIGFYDGDVKELHPWKKEQLDRIEESLEDAIEYIVNYII